MIRQPPVYNKNHGNPRQRGKKRGNGHQIGGSRRSLILNTSILNNESDLFTKPLGSTIHKRLKTKVMNKKTDENEPTKEISSNFSVNYEFTTSIDEELKSLILANGI